MTIYLKPDRRDEAQEFFVSYLENRAQLASPLATLKLQAQDDPSRSAYLSAIEGIVLHMKDRKDQTASRAVKRVHDQLALAGLQEIRASDPTFGNEAAPAAEHPFNCNRPYGTTSRLGVVDWTVAHFDARGRSLPTGSWISTWSVDGKVRFLGHKYKDDNRKLHQYKVSIPAVPTDDLDEVYELVKKRYIILLIKHKASAVTDTLREAVDDVSEFWAPRTETRVAYGLLGNGKWTEALYVKLLPGGAMGFAIPGFADNGPRIQQRIVIASIVITDWPLPVDNPIDRIELDDAFKAALASQHDFDGLTTEAVLEKSKVFTDAMQWVLYQALRSDPENLGSDHERADAVVAEYRRIRTELKRTGGLYLLMEPRRKAFCDAIGYARSLMSGGRYQLKPFHVHHMPTVSKQSAPFHPLRSTHGPDNDVSVGATKSTSTLRTHSRPKLAPLVRGSSAFTALRGRRRESFSERDYLTPLERSISVRSMSSPLWSTPLFRPKET